MKREDIQLYVALDGEKYEKAPFVSCEKIGRHNNGQFIVFSHFAQIIRLGLTSLRASSHQCDYLLLDI